MTMAWVRVPRREVLLTGLRLLLGIVPTVIMRQHIPLRVLVETLRYRQRHWPMPCRYLGDLHVWQYVYGTCRGVRVERWLNVVRNWLSLE